jgi:hypothetical protein
MELRAVRSIEALVLSSDRPLSTMRGVEHTLSGTGAHPVVWALECKHGASGRGSALLMGLVTAELRPREPNASPHSNPRSRESEAAAQQCAIRWEGGQLSRGNSPTSEV